MSESTWYYLDSDRKQQGPVAAAAIREALRGGRIGAATLVWRDGLSEWQPLAQLADELGLSQQLPSPTPTAGNVDALADAIAAVRPATSRGTAGDIVYAGFIRRWAALFLDSLIVAVPLIILAAIVAIPMGLLRAGGDQGPTIAQGVYYLLYLIAAPLYYAGMESSAHQATLGKRALGIKVTDNDGRRLSFGHALGRWFAAALSYFTLYIGFLMAAFTERKRALHDIVAGTLVVDRWAYSEFPERQKRELSGCLIAFLIGVLLIPFVAAVLAAIGVAQFEEYKIRAQVSEGISLADGVKTAVAEYRMNNDAFPTSNGAAGLAAPASISGTYVGRVDVGSAPGEISVFFSNSPPHAANPAINGANLRFSPSEKNGVVEWRCHSDDLKRKWCPRSCECR